MPFTQEPRGLTWINNLNTGTFGSLMTNSLWGAGSLVLTVADYQLLMGSTMQRESGIFLAGILVAAWTGKTVAGVVDAQQKRMADPRAAEVIEAKARGKVAGAAAAVAVQEAVKDAQAARLSGMHQMPVTGERPTMMPIVADHAQQWTSGDPHGGIL